MELKEVAKKIGVAVFKLATFGCSGCCGNCGNCGNCGMLKEKEEGEEFCKSSAT